MCGPKLWHGSRNLVSIAYLLGRLGSVAGKPKVEMDGILGFDLSPFVRLLLSFTKVPLRNSTLSPGLIGDIRFVSPTGINPAVQIGILLPSFCWKSSSL